MINIDGVDFDVPMTNISRTGTSLFKDGAKRTEDGVLHVEIIGVYFNYSVAFGMSAYNVAEYAALWQKINEPVNSHTIIMPDESGDVTFECYFGDRKDEIHKVINGVNYFRGLSFDIIAVSPARTP